MTNVSSLSASPTTAVAQSTEIDGMYFAGVFLKAESEGHGELAEWGICAKNREGHFTWFEIAALTIPMSSALLFSEEVGNAIFVIKTASVKNKVVIFHFKPNCSFSVRTCM